MVATRLRDTAFKRAPRGVPLDTEVEIEGPFGNLKLHNDNSRAAVVLTGGIGITPFRSILLHAAKTRLPHRMFVFYANRRPEDAAFLDELQELEKRNPNYKMIACMSEAEKSQHSWSGERGLISPALLEKYLKESRSPVYYITGPPAMVKAMHAMLLDTGVDDDDLRIEELPAIESAVRTRFPSFESIGLIRIWHMEYFFSRCVQVAGYAFSFE